MKTTGAGTLWKAPPSGILGFCAGVLLLLDYSPRLRAAELQRLNGHVPAAVMHLTSTGQLPGTNCLDLAIGLPLRNPVGLTNLLGQIYSRASTNYHHYLTPAQFTAQFGPTTEDYESVVAFAKTSGLTVTKTHANRVLLDVRGTVTQIERALHVTLRLYPNPLAGRSFYAPDTEPSLNLKVPILHISGLENYTLPHPMSLRKTNQSHGFQGKPWAGSGPNGAFLGNDFRTAYVPNTVMTGMGEQVGLFQIESGYYQSDIVSYEKQAGLPNVPVKPVLLDGYGGGAGAANDECSLDIEMAIAMAPGLSQVLVYEGAVPDDILNQMATDDLAQQLSSSWAFEVDPTTEAIFQQFASQGQSFFNASGDTGAWVGGVLSPSDDPNITIVGGTTLRTATNGAWAAETVWDPDSTNSSGGGISTQYSIPYWQQGIDMTLNQGSSTMRNIPDVAMAADNVYVVFGDGTNGTFSGTSCAAPLWAGFTALVNQQAANNSVSPVGFMNPSVYSLGEEPNYTNLLHDIVQGNNTNDDSDNLFYAVSGYDLCTGWGTPAGQGLMDALVGPASPTPAYIVTQPLSQTVTVGGTVTFNVLPGGLPPFAYQWSLNGTNLAGATNDSLTLEDVQLSQAGDVEVEVTNEFGSEISSGAALTVNLPTSCDADPAGLVSWWPGEGNANDVIGSNNGNLQGGIGFAGGEVGLGFLYDTSTADVDVPASPTLDVGNSSGSFTLEAWINCSSTSELNPMFEWNTGDGVTYEGAHFYVWSDGSLYANIINVGGYPLPGHVIQSNPGQIIPGTFYHVALTYDYPSGVGTIYCNGVVVAQVAVGTYTPLTSYDLYLGCRPLTQGESYTFAGVLDEPSLYNRALAPSEVAAIYNAGSGGKCPPFTALPPVIFSEPTNEIVAASSTATFEVLATGTAPLYYQWFLNGTNAIAGATNSSLTLTNVQLSEAGIYSVAVTNPFGSAGSSNAVLTVTGFPPIITSQPTNQTVDVGFRAVFNVSASGSMPLAYQWKFQGSNLNGATNSSLTMTNVQVDQAGTYSVLVTNGFGSVLSSNALLAVNAADCTPAPTGLVSWWQGQNSAEDIIGTNNGILEGGIAFTNGLVGQAFYYNNTGEDVLIPASSTLNLGTNNLGFTLETWISCANVTQPNPIFEWNQGDGVTLEGVQFYVFPNGSLYGDVVDTSGNLFTHAFQSATGLINSNVFYHIALTFSKTNGMEALYVNGVLVAHQTTGQITPLTSYNLYLGRRPPTQGTTYTFAGILDEATIYNRPLGQSEIQAIYSAGAGGKCLPPPVILTQPTNLDVTIGGTAIFAVNATGAKHLGYQWYLNSTNDPIPEATNSILSLTNVQSSSAGSYWVLVTNSVGSAFSSNALLVVRSIDHFAWGVIPSPQFVKAPFTATIQAQNITNGLVTNFAGTVNLTSSLGIPVQPSVSGAFVQGRWTGSIIVAQAATNLVLEAKDGLGDIGLAKSINVLNPPVLDGARYGNLLLLFWPTNVPGFVIETASRLNASNWIQVDSAPFEFGNTNLEIFPITGSNAFYRLLYTVP